MAMGEIRHLRGNNGADAAFGTRSPTPQAWLRMMLRDSFSCKAGATTWFASAPTPVLTP